MPKALEQKILEFPISHSAITILNEAESELRELDAAHNFKIFKEKFKQRLDAINDYPSKFFLHHKWFKEIKPEWYSMRFLNLEPPMRILFTKYNGRYMIAKCFLRRDKKAYKKALKEAQERIDQLK